MHHIPTAGALATQHDDLIMLISQSVLEQARVQSVAGYYTVSSTTSGKDNLR